MKEHKRLADEQPEDGQMCDVSVDGLDKKKHDLGVMMWKDKRGCFYSPERGVYIGNPWSIWWRVKW